jgi:hypothetical protein
MPPRRAAKPAAQPSRLRRFLLLELPGWLILAVSVSYSVSASGGRRTVFFQVLLITAALAWLAGGRSSNVVLGSLLFGWAAGTMAWFNLLAIASIGLFLLPVTGYVGVVLVLLEAATPTPSRLAAGAGIGLAIVVQLAGLGLLASGS